MSGIFHHGFDQKSIWKPCRYSRSAFSSVIWQTCCSKQIFSRQTSFLRWSWFIFIFILWLLVHDKCKYPAKQNEKFYFCMSNNSFSLIIPSDIDDKKLMLVSWSELYIYISWSCRQQNGMVLRLNISYTSWNSNMMLFNMDQCFMVAYICCNVFSPTMKYAGSGISTPTYEAHGTWILTMYQSCCTSFLWRSSYL